MTYFTCDNVLELMLLSGTFLLRVRLVQGFHAATPAKKKKETSFENL